LPASTPNPLTTLTTPGGNGSAISSITSSGLARVCSAGLITTQLPAARGGRQLPGGHQDGEVPRDDLADHAQRLLVMVRDRIGVDLAHAAFLGADHSGEVAEVVDGERQVGGRRLAYRLAVLPGLGDRELREVRLDPVGDPVGDGAALGGRGPAPLVGGGVRGAPSTTPSGPGPPAGFRLDPKRPCGLTSSE